MSGKLVKSAWATGNGLLVEDSLVEPGVEVTIAIANARGHRGAQATVNRADLLTAVARKGDRPSIVETRIEHWKERAERAEASVERVHKVLDTLWSRHPARKAIEDALAGVEQFELPTKTWSGIVGEHFKLGEMELRLFPDGMWTYCVGSPMHGYRSWSPVSVLGDFTGLRLVEY